MDTAAALRSPQDRPAPGPPRPAPAASVTALVRPVEHPLGHLDLLESHAIFIIREVAAESERPVLLFSGGKDSAVLLHLAAKAFKPGRIPFPVLHVDTGHNFPEVLDYRDAQVEAEGARLIVARVQDSIDQGRVADPGPVASRNRLQTTTLLDAINAHGFDAAFGGARRDEDKATGQGAGPLLPRLLRPVGPQAPAPRALAALPGQRAPGRAPPRLPAVGLDRARHLAVHPPRAHRAALHLLRPRARGRRARRHAAGAQRVGRAPQAGEEVRKETRALPHRRRRHLHRRGALRRRHASRRSSARSSASRISERGATRADDRFSETAMEDRKREGYF